MRNIKSEFEFRLAADGFAILFFRGCLVNPQFKYNAKRYYFVERPWIVFIECFDCKFIIDIQNYTQYQTHQSRIRS